ncbi:AraC family transcriptional regulator [Stenotrophomonas sp. HITSZ_GD]|uniref:AraC family transcriptional regulator n=1 Tax=Stenotrophomonas sp. HITSZ_GD TaxID=3037248 RepID=UPI00240DE475|nr:AraC family transcriptional regulator [Stenotrophomonas sp. HITSZ_GD]MDG2523816.1 AraC family transcriptional regulator [Stenotrophomonas sp. HITSZ_GD]
MDARTALALDELSDLIRRHARHGDFAAFPGAMLVRADQPSAAVSVVAEPMFCLVGQGVKRIVMGERVLQFGRGDSLAVTMSAPVASEIVRASPRSPYLAVGFALDTSLLAELVLTLPELAPPASSSGMVDLQPVAHDLLDAAVRAMRLLDDTASAPVLAPLIARELHYRLLTGPHGAVVRALVRGRGINAQIARAAAWIRRHYHEPLRIAELARLAALSESSLHRGFKAVTGMTPLEYQKRIRLQEARSRLLMEGSDAASVGFSVGYNSPSQFSREYARQFGLPPARDVAQLRAESGALAYPAW